MRIGPDGKQDLLGHGAGTSNGISIDQQGNILAADIQEQDGVIRKIRPDGTHEVILSEIDGRPLDPPNSVFVDSQGRLWIPVSTRTSPWFEALARPRPDGYIILMDEKGPRIVADGILFTNEARLDPSEQYLYAAAIGLGNGDNQDGAARVGKKEGRFPHLGEHRCAIAAR